MQELYAFLKKYNCIWVRIETEGSLRLRVFGKYATPAPEKVYPLSEIVYVEDFPILMSRFGELSSAGGDPRLYMHFRVEIEQELHWAYLCVERAEEGGVYRGVLLDVYEYLECVPNDGVITEFESRQKRKISDLNNNGASLEEICGKDYLKKVQQPFEKMGMFSAIYDENGRLICSQPENTDVLSGEYKAMKKAAIRFNHKEGGVWCVGINNERNAKNAGLMLDALADDLSRIAHSFVLLYNETENSRAVNKQLGTNVEQQIMINNIYSLIMEEPETEKALSAVLEMTARYLRVERVAAYLPAGEDRQPALICHYETDDGDYSAFDEYVSANFDSMLSRLGTTQHFFSEDTEKYLVGTGVSAFAISKMSAGERGVGMIFYQVYDPGRHWEYNDRRLIRNVSQAISGLVLRQEMDEEIREKNQQLTRLAFYDTVLDIRNRAKLDEDAEEILKETRSGIAMAVQILNTRALNEVFGQNYTDNLLRMVCEFLSRPEMGGENVYRFSGSIIFLLLEGENSDGAQRIAREILARFADPFMIDGIEQYAEAAVGIAAFDPAFTGIQDLYRATALSLYRANEYGKNSLAFFNREFHSSTSSAYHLEQELRRCIADNMRNFELAFQPVYSGEEVHHYETLLRWRSEKEGRVSPRVFMKLMEKVGLDSAIDFWVIPRACAFCRDIRSQTGTDVRVSVNLTVREMQSGLIPGAVQSALNETNIPSDALIVEVPEASHVLAGNETAATLGRLKRMGVCICVDSFGSEYLPLHVLKYSYIDMVKLNASFVTNSGDSFDAALVKTVIDLADSRGITVIVKNIQYKAQLEAAKSYGMECFQGELLTPPVTAFEITERLLFQAREEQLKEEEA